MNKKATSVPDAWDEDWEAIADKEEEEEEEEDEENNSKSDSTQPVEHQKQVSSKVSKAQRRAQHAEFNRQLWAEAEETQTFHFLESRTTSVPFKSDYKPPVKLLSRKPQIARRPSASSALESAVSGLQIKSPNATNDDVNDNDEDSDDNGKGSQRQQELTPEERQAIALREREEKQRKYEEVRERLFGTTSGAGSGASSPGSATPPPMQSQSQNQNQRQENRFKGKIRQDGRSEYKTKENSERRDSPTTAGRSRQLFDPGSSTKPNSNYAQRRDSKQRRANHNTGDADDDQQGRPQAPIRNPRGPDGSGRGGFGFNQNAGRGK